MKNLTKKTIIYVGFEIVGIALLVASIMKNIDSFWGGIAIGLMAVSTLRLIQIWRFQNNEVYAKEVNVKYGDERNRFLGDKAKSVAFMVSLLTAAVFVIVLNILSFSKAATILGLVVCGQLVIYLICYFVVKGRY